MVKCEQEVYSVSICDKCVELLADKKGYVPLVCWECGTIIDIFVRRADISTDMFCDGCRECGNAEGEKNTFMVKRDG